MWKPVHFQISTVMMAPSAVAWSLSQARIKLSKPTNSKPGVQQTEGGVVNPGPEQADHDKGERHRQKEGGAKEDDALNFLIDEQRQKKPQYIFDQHDGNGEDDRIRHRFQEYIVAFYQPDVIPRADEDGRIEAIPTMKAQVKAVDDWDDDEDDQEDDSRRHHHIGGEMPVDARVAFPLCDRRVGRSRVCSI